MSWLVNSCRITYVWSTSFPRGHPRFTIANDSRYKFPYMVNLLQCRTDSRFVSIYVSLCWVEIILTQEKAFWINYTDNHVSFESILLSLLCHTTVGDHYFLIEVEGVLVQGCGGHRKLWTSCSTDQTGGDQKRREEKIKEKKEGKSHRSGRFSNESSAFVT